MSEHMKDRATTGEGGLAAGTDRSGADTADGRIGAKAGNVPGAESLGNEPIIGTPTETGAGGGDNAGFGTSDSGPGPATGSAGIGNRANLTNDYDPANHERESFGATQPGGGNALGPNTSGRPGAHTTGSANSVTGGNPDRDTDTNEFAHPFPRGMASETPGFEQASNAPQSNRRITADDTPDEAATPGTGTRERERFDNEELMGGGRSGGTASGSTDRGIMPESGEVGGQTSGMGTWLSDEADEDRNSGIVLGAREGGNLDDEATLQETGSRRGNWESDDETA